MKNISYKAISIILFAILLLMERTHFVTDFLSDGLMFALGLVLLMDFVMPLLFNDGSDAQKNLYKKCECSSVIIFSALDLHAVIRHLSLRFSFPEDPIVIPMYLFFGFLLVKNFIAIYRVAQEKRRNK